MSAPKRQLDDPNAPLAKYPRLVEYTGVEPETDEERPSGSEWDEWDDEWEEESEWEHESIADTVESDDGFEAYNPDDFISDASVQDSSSDYEPSELGDDDEE